MFNAPNAAGITARNTTMTLTSPADPVTITNLPYDADGNILPDSRAAEQLRLRPGDRLAGPAHGAGSDSVLVLGCTRHR